MEEEWKEVQDDQGRTYYYNVNTQETSWTNPAKINSSWKAYTTEDGRSYYHNEATGETTWEAPEGFKEEEIDETGLVGSGELKQDANEEDSKDDGKISSLNENLSQKATTKSGIVEPPHFNAFSEAEEAFKDMLKRNNVDSTWSFQAVISKFVKEPIYWAIPDASHRKKLYDEYLVQRLKDEMNNKFAVTDSFKTNFIKLLSDYQGKGLINQYTRWSSIKKILILEDNPIYKNTVLSDLEISKIFTDFVQKIKDELEVVRQEKKQQALNELEAYLMQINPTLASQSESWLKLYENLTHDSRFKANKHFAILSKLDILELYISKIYPKIIKELEAEVELHQKRNYRNDRKAREKFKEFLTKNVTINANSLFKDILPTIENEESFIELCGRKGSTPLDFFWDIVDEKYQVMRLKQNLVESILTNLKNLWRDKEGKYGELFSSKSKFFDTLASLKDDRLSAFEFKISEEDQQDNELEIIYDTLKRQHVLHKERERANLEKSLCRKREEFAKWLVTNHEKYNLVQNGQVEQAPQDLSQHPLIVKHNTQPESYSLYQSKEFTLKQIFQNRFNNVDAYDRLIKTFKQAQNTGIERPLDQEISELVSQFLELLNRPQPTTSQKEPLDASRKRNFPDHQEEYASKKLKHDTQRNQPSDTVKSNPILLNY